MPSLQQHLNQYNLNIKTLYELKKLDAPPNDWVVTVAFYSALHLVEKVFAREGIHHRTHKERNNEIRTNLYFDEIAAPYNALFRDSMKSRYDCESITDGKVTIALDCLKKIEAFCMTR